MPRYRIAFAGTGAFAAPILTALHHVATIPCVFVRGANGTSDSPVVTQAKELGLPCHITTKGNDLLEHCASMALDGLLVTDFGLMIPAFVLELLPDHVFNVHPSLLPKYRGAIPIPATILAGDTTTGVSLMVLDSAMDHGPLIAQREHSLTGHEYAPQLEASLGALGAELVRDNLIPYLAHEQNATPQKHDEATLTSRLTRAHGYVTIEQETADTLYKKIRAFAPWPGCYTAMVLKKRNRTVKFITALPCLEQHTATTGLYRQDKALHLVTGSGCLRVEHLQVDGGRAVDAESFINGYFSSLPMLPNNVSEQ